ncbi:glycosyltransferase family 4 protein [Cytobacillus firmus]|uniref:glycosyltransferase family 4 protein n=1 Tax=Cytobacillus firmus TaxID=1399 RepID=UPI002161EA4F|nr:glycosyltransferase [Cytobacillus firmus]MCS0654821.1 glycosyltransferase [Cytobacillus firmus]
MRFLYVAPRFHTNQYYSIKSLLNKHEVFFWACYNDFSEIYLPIEYEKIKFSLFSKRTASRLPDKNRMKYLRKRALPNFVWLIKRFIQINPDVVVIRDWSYTNIIIAVLSKFARKKCILYNQFPVYNSELKQEKHIFNSLYNARISPVYGSGSIKNKKDHFVPFVIEKSEARNRRYFKDNKINILIIGKYTKRKRIYEFIKHLNCKEYMKYYRITVIGQATSKEQKEYYNKCQSIKGENVELLKNIPYETISKYYLDNDIFILTSEDEPASYSIIEAMRYGLVVFSPDENGTSNYIDNGKNGYIYSTKDFDFVLNKVNLLEKNRELTITMAQRSSEIINQFYESNNYSEKIEELISNLNNK